jgi:hypothetical protein
MPSGIAYAVAARETVRDLLAVEPPQHDVSLVFGELTLALQDAAPARRGRVAQPYTSATRA